MNKDLTSQVSISVERAYDHHTGREENTRRKRRVQQRSGRRTTREAVPRRYRSLAKGFWASAKWEVLGLSSSSY